MHCKDQDAMLTACLLLVSSLSLLLALLAHALVHWLSAQQDRYQPGRIPISVLKPLKGMDDELETNLESFCAQTHPQYEILFGVADRLDPALPIARRVAARHSELTIRVVVGQCPTGLNPKVRILRALIRNARYDALLISDSNVRVNEHYLATIAAELEDPQVGLVSNPIMGQGDSTVGSALESLQLNSYVIHGLVLANFVGKHPCVVGKSMLLRRSALSKIGGLGKFADVLAEDYLIGREISRAGYRVVTSPSAITTINRSWTLQKLWQRHLRWSQIRRTLGSPGYLLELLLLPHVWLLLSAISALCVGAPHLGMSPKAIAMACGAAYAVTWLSEAAALLRWCGHRPSLGLLAIHLGLRQFAQLLCWFVAWFKHDVTWRGNHLRIGKGSQLSDPRKTTRQPSPSFARQAA
jgi:ceramide glucosyltransferase